MVRRGYVPFFFRPLQFLVFDPVTVITFAGLTVAAVRATASAPNGTAAFILAGCPCCLDPAFGRLLPLPLLQPLAWEATFVVTLLFPLAGMWADIRRRGHVHPAWHWGVATMIGALVGDRGDHLQPGRHVALSAGCEGNSPGASIDPPGFQAAARRSAHDGPQLSAQKRTDTPGIDFGIGRLVR